MNVKQVSDEIEKHLDARKGNVRRARDIKAWHRMVGETMPEFTAGFPYLPDDNELALAPGYPDDSHRELQDEIARLMDEDKSLWPKDMFKDFPKDPDYKPPRWEVVNSWRLPDGNILVVQRHSQSGDRQWSIMSQTHILFSLMSRYMTASQAWSLKAEIVATKKLRECLPPWKYKQYVLTGMFWEESKRSKVRYLFRKGRPTVACKYDMFETDDDTWNGHRILGCLCFHPVGYYRGTWAGGLCPTDDIIAALKLMRADEHMFWKKSNVHAPDDPLGGLFP